MKLAKIYNKVSKTYNNDSRCVQVISVPKQMAVAKLIERQLLKPHANVLDLGVGNGEFLDRLYRVEPELTFSGLDISSAMLEIASSKLPLTTYQSTIDKASAVLTHNAFDLVVANFVCAYVPFATVLAQSYKLLKAKGVLTMITSTHQTFANVQQQLTAMQHSGKLAKKITHYLTKRAIKHTTVPRHASELLETATALGFKVLDHQPFTTAIEFNDAKEFITSVFNSGWAVSAMNYRWIPVGLAYKVTQYLSKCFTYPIQDKAVVEIVLLQK